MHFYIVATLEYKESVSLHHSGTLLEPERLESAMLGTPTWSTHTTKYVDRDVDRFVVVESDGQPLSSEVTTFFYCIQRTNSWHTGVPEATYGRCFFRTVLEVCIDLRSFVLGVFPDLRRLATRFRR